MARIIGTAGTAPPARLPKVKPRPKPQPPNFPTFVPARPGQTPRQARQTHNMDVLNRQLRPPPKPKPRVVKPVRVVTGVQPNPDQRAGQPTRRQIDRYKQSRPYIQAVQRTRREAGADDAAYFATHQRVVPAVYGPHHLPTPAPRYGPHRIPAPQPKIVTDVPRTDAELRHFLRTGERPRSIKLKLPPLKDIGGGDIRKDIYAGPVGATRAFLGMTSGQPIEDPKQLLHDVVTTIKNLPNSARETAVTLPSSLAHQAVEVYHVPQALLRGDTESAAKQTIQIGKELVHPLREIQKNPEKMITTRPVETASILAGFGRTPGFALGKLARLTGRQTLEGAAAELPHTALTETRTRSRSFFRNRRQAARDAAQGPPTVSMKDINTRVDEFHELRRTLKAQHVRQAVADAHDATRGQPKDVQDQAMQEAASNASAAFDLETKQLLARQFGATERPAVPAAHVEQAEAAAKAAEDRRTLAFDNLKKARALLNTETWKARLARANQRTRSTPLLTSLRQKRNQIANERPPAYAHDYQPTAAGINAKTHYHGTNVENLRPEHLDATGTDEANLFGQGVYLTDNPQVAASYARARARGRGGRPVVYKAKLNVQNPLDMKATVHPKFAEAIRHAAAQMGHLTGGETDVAEAVHAALQNPRITNGELYHAFSRAVTDYSHTHQVPKSEFTEIFQDLAGNLRHHGFDALTHVGGEITQSRFGHHQVTVLLDPQHRVSVRAPEPTAAAEAAPADHYPIQPGDIQDARAAEPPGTPGVSEKPTVTLGKGAAVSLRETRVPSPTAQAVADATRGVRHADRDVNALKAQLDRAEQRGSQLQGRTEGRFAAGKMTEGAGKAAADQAEHIAHINAALKEAQDVAVAARDRLKEATAAHAKYVKDATAELDQQISAEHKRIQGVPTAEHQSLLNAIAGHDAAALAHKTAIAEHDYLEGVRKDVTRAHRQTPVTDPAAEGRIFDNERDAKRVVYQLNQLGMRIPSGNTIPLQTHLLPPSEEVSALGHWQPNRTVAITRGRGTVPVRWKVMKIGEDQYAAVPDAPRQRMYGGGGKGAYLSHASVGTGKSTVARGMRVARGNMTKSTLPQSLKWLAGQIGETPTRMLTLGAGPFDYARFMMIKNRMNRDIPGSGDLMEQTVVGGGMHSPTSGIGEHLFDEPSLAQTFEGASQRTQAVARTLSYLGAKPGITHLRAANRWFTARIMRDINGFVALHGGRAMAGHAIRHSPLMPEHLPGLLDRAIQQAADGLQHTPEQVAAGRTFDEMFGKYRNHSPETRSLLLHWTPFIPWFINAAKFIAFTLPVKHPIRQALLADISLAQEDWRKRNRISYYAPNHVPSFLLGRYPNGKGGLIPLGHYMPWGLGADLFESGAQQILPWLQTALKNAAGINWKDKALVNPDGTPFSDVQKAALAMLSIAEAQVPWVGPVAQVSGVEQKNFNRQTNVPSFEERLKSRLPWYPTQPLGGGKVIGGLSTGGELPTGAGTLGTGTELPTGP